MSIWHADILILLHSFVFVGVFGIYVGKLVKWNIDIKKFGAYLHGILELAGGMAICVELFKIRILPLYGDAGGGRRPGISLPLTLPVLVQNDWS